MRVRPASAGYVTRAPLRVGGAALWRRQAHARETTSARDSNFSTAAIPKRRRSTKKRAGRNPATGEEITIAAKPASVDVRARPLAKAKAALPSGAKARR
jgi:hypothetical protein